MYYPLETPEDAVSDIPRGARYFTTLDAAHGYWQIPLAEDYQRLTAFITSWGRYKFLRAPMGLSSTGDEYCRRGDIALAGIDNLQKVVDDILAHDTTFSAYIERIWNILTRCKEQGITLNANKFTYVQEQVHYLG